MAKITRFSLLPQYFKVKIDVNDPECIFSIKPAISYMKVFKAYSVNTAVRAAASYCNRYMKEYRGVEFKYSTNGVEPYYFPLTSTAKKEDL